MTETTLHSTGPRTFEADARNAVADVHLRGALRKATALFGERRREALATVADWDGDRECARAIKDETLRNLDRYLEQFSANAERAGAKVHWARDGGEACDIISGIARARQASSVVKSKSMATEEIHLNAALASHGIDVVETDLGEYIIQLAGETPSHIVVPAIHKTASQVSELFAEKLGVARSTDTSALTRIARDTLRAKFAAAHLGVSGVNFGVAETGTILILENEGNARLTTSLPRAHVALMGIEKVIPRFADLEVFLRLLPRSGTGQRITTYQSLLTGVKRRPDDEGPEELHIVLLDNGRSRLLSHPLTRQSLMCIRCGACLNACPVYQQIGGHAYGSVYPGPIGAVITPQLAGIHQAGHLPYASSLCGACREVCPVKIDIPALLLHLRARSVEEHAPRTGGGFRERLAFRLYALVTSRPALFRRATNFARAVQRMAGMRGLLRRPGAIGLLVPPLDAWTAWRDLRPLAPSSFRDQWKAQARKDAERGGET